MSGIPQVGGDEWVSIPASLPIWRHPNETDEQFATRVKWARRAAAEYVQRATLDLNRASWTSTRAT